MSHLLQRYYKTDHWKNFSAALLDDKEIICEICGRPRWKLLEKGPKKGVWKRLVKFNVHHKNYECLNNETRDDVLVLCQQCHKLCHEICKPVRGIAFYEDLRDLIKKYGFVYEKSLKNKVLKPLKEKKKKKKK